MDSTTMVPVTVAAFLIIENSSLKSPDAHNFVLALIWVNGVLLAFNLLPIYPLDGGQIFRGLLWFLVGPIRSLVIAAWVGLILGAAGIVFVLWKWQAWWLAIMMGLIVQQSWMTISRIGAARREGRL